MNIFLPQSIQTQIELEEIADVKRQIISPASSTPIIGVVQDGLLGAYNLTDPSMKFDWRDAMNIISYTTIDELSTLKKDKKYNGKELFSLIIPSNINSNIGGLEVKNGKIINGQIHKAHLGSKKRNSLIHLIWDEYGIEYTKQFIDNTQRLINNFNLINGFTVGVGDIYVPDDIKQQLNKMIETKKLEVNHMITEMENNPDLLDDELFEETILSEMNTILGDVSKIIMNNITPENHFGIMINSGSKGGPVNMGQMGACVAQASVEGKRIRKKLNGRSIQYYHKDDDSALARGLIEQSFLEGLEPKAFILHNMGSREGLIDTAIKTASTGYIQRKLIKSTEDAMIKYDLTVRTANDTVLQFIYGDNGIDSTKQSNIVLKILSMGNKEIADKFKFTNQELKNYPNFSNNDNNRYYEDLLNMRDQLRNAVLKSSLDHMIMKDNFMIPVNLYRIINNISYSDEKYGSGKLTPDYVLKKLDDILDYKNTMITCMSKEESENPNSFKFRDEILSKTLFKFALHEHLGPKISIFKHGLTKGKFDEIYKQIKEVFNNSVVEAGEMVGTIGAQSIGEPLTQLTLNSIDWNDKIIIEEDGIFKTAKIGKFIDDYIQNNKDITKRLEDNKEEEMGDTYYVDVSKKNIMTISIDKDGKLSWNKVSALTKHLPMNKDGTNELVKIRTASGRHVTATKAKSFLTIMNNSLIPTKGESVNIGDYVPVMKNIPNNKHKTEININLNKFDQNFSKSLNDVYYDEIISIEIVKPTNKYVYDLTVDKDKTFIIANGIACYDTFHAAGIGAKGTTTLGVPRMNELLSFSKNIKTPQMIIYLEEKIRKNENIAYKIASSVKYTILKDVVRIINVYYNPDPYRKGSYMDRDNTKNIFHSYKPSKYSCQSDISNLPWLMRIELNKEELMDKDITLLDIKSKFCNFWEKRFNDTKGMKKDEKQILEKITQCAILSNNINDKTPIIHIRFDMVNFNLSTITEFLEKFIEPFKLKGIDSISDSEIINDRLINFDNDDKELQKDSQNLIYTKGINMKKIRYINGINLNKTKCNDVVDVYHTFGIEAARTVLMSELNFVFTGSGNSVNFQHLSILVDVMTNNGKLTSIDRHGLNNLNTDPLARASFEKTVDQLIAAAVFGEIDHMKSTSSRIMAGQVVKGGTGLCDLVLNTNMLQNSEYDEELEQKYQKTFNELSVDSVVSDVLNKGEIEDIFIPV